MTETTATPLDLDDIEARANKATPGPYQPEWEHCDCGGDYSCGHGPWIYALRLPEPHTDRDGAPADYDFLYSEVGEFTPETLAFFVRAREDVPALVAKVRELNAHISRITNAAEDVLADAERAETDALFSGAAEPICMRSAAMKALREAILALPAVEQQDAAVSS